MDSIGVRELRQHASRYLDRVRRGESLEVTDRGELVALLVPPSSDREAVDRLSRQGRLLPSSDSFRPPTRRLTAAERSEDVLDQLRSQG